MSYGGYYNMWNAIDEEIIRQDEQNVSDCGYTRDSRSYSVDTDHYDNSDD